MMACLLIALNHLAFVRKPSFSFLLLRHIFIFILILPFPFPSTHPSPLTSLTSLTLLTLLTSLRFAGVVERSLCDCVRLHGSDLHAAAPVRRAFPAIRARGRRRKDEENTQGTRHQHARTHAHIECNTCPPMSVRVNDTGYCILLLKLPLVCC